VEMGDLGERGGGSALRQLQQEVWLPGRGDRLHDLDMAVDYGGAARRRTRCGDGAPDHARQRRGAGRVCRRPSGPTFSVERSAAAIAFREAPTPARGPAQENGRAETLC
jgi:hypothetical protein